MSKKETQDRNQVAQKPCLACGRMPNEGEIFSRGICSRDMKRFQRVMDRFDTDAERAAFENQAIAAGNILPVAKRGPKPVDRDVFAELYEEMLSPETKSILEQAKKANAKLDEQQKKKRGGK